MTRIAIVDNEKLKDMPLKRYIQKSCPVNRTGKECITIADDGRLLIDEALCTGCGICPKLAPSAIKIINLPEELKEMPVHRYGENLFVLYSIPTPLFGNVTAIVGVNGIGKSSAIKILAGVLKPNFGDWKRPDADMRELVSYFKGTEAQQFFEDVTDGLIRVSYKPQQVELIPRTVKGSVGKLLRKADEQGKADEIMEQLGLTAIQNNDIATISGGELQRVAIAGAVLKKANLYIFDEPTGFLDIKQRIRVSQFLKTLVGEHTAVLVVDHDLVILDYIADLVQVMYGKEGCYGIVSGVKPVKRGINVYLDGYLKEENVRFRHAIHFEPRLLSGKKKKDILTHWQDIAKKLDAFSLSAPQGAIHKSEIVGMLGENGIGKTTFVRILAAVLRQDAGTLESSVKVSYKPQYIEPSDEMVQVALAGAFQKYMNQLIKPFGIEEFAERKLSELSGGELQRVAIAYCLSQDANLYLLDEPSAYLDIEQRLLLSKVLREFIEHKGASALVVDHDLLFMEYISDRIMVCTGVPAVRGTVRGPFEKEEGMNLFLKELGITLRRDEETHRPRVNTRDSRLDRTQKEAGRYYYQ